MEMEAEALRAQAEKEAEAMKARAAASRYAGMESFRTDQAHKMAHLLTTKTPEAARLRGFSLLAQWEGFEPSGRF